MRIQPIAQTISYKSKRKIHANEIDKLDKLEKLGAKFAVSGGIVMPAGSTPEKLAEFNKILEEGAIKPIRSCISTLLDNCKI